jgi:hypothetical protein
MKNKLRGKVVWIWLEWQAQLGVVEDLPELKGVQGAAVPQLALLDGLEGTAVLGSNQIVERVGGKVSIGNLSL